MNTTKKIQYIACASLAITAMLSSCKKDDNGMSTPTNTVSKLFVSNADTDPAALNLTVFNPADNAMLGAPMQYNSATPDGNGIVYDGVNNIGFKVSRANKAVRLFSVEKNGIVNLGNTFTDLAMVSGRDAAYDANNKTLYVASNTDSTIRVYTNAPNLSGTVTANKVIKLNGQPWGIDFAAGKLIVLIDLNRKEVQLFNNINAASSGTLTPTSIITIPAATRLHGLVYHAASDVLLVTEIGAAAAPTMPDPNVPAFNADGGIYIIESAMSKFNSNAAVTPNRTIFGTNTKLGNPVDITYDGRMGKNLIYVAEKANKMISVFKLSDNGNAMPTTSVTLSTSPESIYVDAR